MSEFFFIRHGETDWNVQGLMQGSTDIPLNDTGRAQALAARYIIAHVGITRIISSPLSRAFETAQIINESHGLPMTVERGLVERGFGIYEGYHRSTAPSVNGSIADGNPDEKIEPFDAVKARAQAAIENALHLHRDDRLLFVAHGAVFSAISDLFCGRRGGCDNAVPYHFKKQGDIWQSLVVENAQALKIA